MRQIVNVDSEFSIAGSSTDFRVSLDQQVEDAERITLLHASFPYTFYSVGSLVVDESGAGGSTFTLELPQESYTQASLAGLLQTQMNTKSTVPQVYTVSWDATQRKYTFSAPGSFSLGFGASTGAISRVLGFSKVDVSGTSLTSDGISNLNESYILLDVQPLPTDMITHYGLSTNFILPVMGNFGDIIHISRNNTWRQFLPLEFKGKDIRDLRITLRFKDGTQIPSLNNGQLHLVFGVYGYDNQSAFWRDFYRHYDYE